MANQCAEFYNTQKKKRGISCTYVKMPLKNEIAAIGLDNGYINSRGAFLTLLNVKSNLITFV